VRSTHQPPSPKDNDLEDSNGNVCESAGIPLAFRNILYRMFEGFTTFWQNHYTQQMKQELLVHNITKLCQWCQRYEFVKKKTITGKLGILDKTTGAH
jgi:hypothetical protein